MEAGSFPSHNMQLFKNKKWITFLLESCYPQQLLVICNEKLFFNLIDFLKKKIEVIVDPHAVVRSNTEKFFMKFDWFPPSH